MNEKPHIIRFNREWICSDFAWQQGRWKTTNDAYNAWALKALAQMERACMEGSARK